MDILLLDEVLIAVNKPAGLRSIPDGYDATLPHLSGQLKETFTDIWVVHRLDKDTSGVILFARNEEAHRSLSEQFRERETGKEYHAIVIGEPEWRTTTAALPLRINGDRRHRTVIDHQNGKPAQTDLRLLAGAGGFALIEAHPHTGYTHQIRAHLAALGFPIFGDPLYRSLQPETALQAAAKSRAGSLPIQRTALHAWAITFQHPLTNTRVTITAPYPTDFAKTIGELFEK